MAIRLGRAAARLAPLYAAVAAAALVGMLVIGARHGVFAYDFHYTIWQPGKAILHGSFGYPRASVVALRHTENLGVYPPLTLLLTAPLALLPATVAGAVWLTLIVAALIASLLVVGVRDWRVIAIVLFSFPAVSNLKLGNLSAFLALGCALVWRWRDTRGVRLPVCVAVTIALKLLLWPLLLWLAFTGRRRQAFQALAIAAGATLVAWAALGFSAFTTYPRLLSALGDAYGATSYSLYAAAVRFGLPAPHLYPLAAALVLCVLSFRLARSGRELESLAAAIGAGILGSPIVWLHYAVILVVPLAARFPKLGPVWALPLLFWLAPFETGESRPLLLVGLASLLLLLVAAARQSRRDVARPSRAGLRLLRAAGSR